MIPPTSRRGAEGAEVIYALRNSDKLSKLILDNLSQAGQIIRKYYQRRLPSNPSKDYYYMLRETPNTEAVIVEYGFLDNKNDANKLKNNYKNYADAVIRAVLEYKNLPYSLPNDNYYTVKSGDTLWTIAKNNGLTVNELKEINNLNNNSISIGQKLKINKNLEIEPINGGNIYTVKSGDTLYKIAKQNNMTVEEIKKLNRLDTDILSIGQKLILSNQNDDKVDTTLYIVKSGDSLYSIALNYGLNVEDLKNVNNLKSNIISVGQQLIIPNSPTYDIYTVKSGDTLYGIALKYGVSLENIKKTNNLTSNTLSIGQKLLIP